MYQSIPNLDVKSITMSPISWLCSSFSLRPAHCATASPISRLALTAFRAVQSEHSKHYYHGILYEKKWMVSSGYIQYVLYNGYLIWLLQWLHDTKEHVVHGYWWILMDAFKGIHGYIMLYTWVILVDLHESIGSLRNSFSSANGSYVANRSIKIPKHRSYVANILSIWNMDPSKNILLHGYNPSRYTYDILWHLQVATRQYFMYTVHEQHAHIIYTYIQQIVSYRQNQT